MKNVFLFLSLSVIALSCKTQIELKEKIVETYENGKPYKVEYYKQLKDSSVFTYYKEFYPNDTLKVEGGVKNNERNDYWTFYYENGNKWSEGSYNEGIAKGKFIQYYETGEIRGNSFYTNGTKTKDILYSLDGEILQENTY